MTVYVNNVNSNYLTTGVDTAVVEGNTKDVIYGSITVDGNDSRSTFNDNDTIIGNNKTALNLTVAGWDGVHGLDLPGVDVSGLRALYLKNLTAQTAPGTISLDATNWGDSLQKIALSGSKNASLEVTDLTVGSQLVVTASGAAQGVTITDAAYGSALLDVVLDNSRADETVAKAQVTSTKVQAIGGTDDVVEVTHTLATAGAGVNLDLALARSQPSGAGHSSVDLTWESTAAVGALTIGKLAATGDTADVHLSAKSETTAAAASIGNVGITTIALNGSTASNLDVTVDLLADADVGNASVGTVNVTAINARLAGGATGQSSDVAINIDASTDVLNLDGVASVGAVNIGAVNAGTVTGSFSTALDIAVDGNGGKLGNGNSLASLTVGAATIGVTNGNAGYNVHADVNHGTIGEVSIGNVGLSVAGGANAASMIINIDAQDSLGNVTLHDLVVNAGTGADLSVGKVTEFSVNLAGKSVGNVDIGHVELDSDGNVDSTGFAGVQIASTLGTIGTVDVGTIDLDGSAGATWAKDISLSASAATNLGAVTVDEVEIEAQTGNDIELAAAFTSAGGNTGTVTFNDLDLDASGTGANAEVSIDVQAVGTTGKLTVGDVFLAGHNNDKVAGTASLNVHLTSDIGDIEIGDVDLSSDATVSGQLVSADVSLATSATGNIDIGNVTVTGNGVNDNFEILDSTSTGGWLDAEVLSPASPPLTLGVVTIGEIDYSAYTGAADIDVSGWEGASVIKGSSGGTVAQATLITGNAGENEIILSTQALSWDTVFYAGNQDNGLVFDTADVIRNFEGGAVGQDILDIVVTPGTTTARLSGPQTAASYGLFTSQAEGADVSVYYAKITTTTDEWCVAVDSDGDTNVDYVFTVHSATDLANGDFNVH